MDASPGSLVTSVGLQPVGVDVAASCRRPRPHVDRQVFVLDDGGPGGLLRDRADDWTRKLRRR